jgi:hypothetical protein
MTFASDVHGSATTHAGEVSPAGRVPRIGLGPMLLILVLLLAVIVPQSREIVTGLIIAAAVWGAVLLALLDRAPPAEAAPTR